MEALAVCVLFLLASATAQTFGEVTGRVSDPSGAAVPASSISITNVNTNAVRNTVSTDPGDYSITHGARQKSERFV